MITMKGHDRMSLETELMSVTDAALALNVDRSRVNVLLRQGRFAGAVKIGRNWIIPRASVEGFQRLPPGGRKNTKQQKAEDEAMMASVREQLRGAVKDGHSREDSGAKS